MVTGTGGTFMHQGEFTHPRELLHRPECLRLREFLRPHESLRLRRHKFLQPHKLLCLMVNGTASVTDTPEVTATNACPSGRDKSRLREKKQQPCANGDGVCGHQQCEWSVPPRMVNDRRSESY